MRLFWERVENRVERRHRVIRGSGSGGDVLPTHSSCLMMLCEELNRIKRANKKRPA